LAHHYPSTALTIALAGLAAIDWLIHLDGSLATPVSVASLGQAMATPFAGGRGVVESDCQTAGSSPGGIAGHAGKAATRRRHMIKLTGTREITAYLWVHPDEER
jgi:hypothetical protein